jgi:hypothetical protein
MQVLGPYLPTAIITRHKMTFDFDNFATWKMLKQQLGVETVRKLNEIVSWL